MKIPSDAKFWRVTCHVGQHPGQWQYWFMEQCCAVGWHPPRWRGLVDPGACQLEGNGNGRGWNRARNCLAKIKAGDFVIANIPSPSWRVGRIGEVVRVAVRDDQWDPIIQPTEDQPFGENGRRIQVRWDLTLGPSDPSRVVLLPEHARWNAGENRATIQELSRNTFDLVREAMNDESNWTSLSPAFSLEKPLSDYIAAHPWRLEAGLIVRPSLSTREHSFQDRSRADVVLQDKNGKVVIAECKQNSPSTTDLQQAAHYRKQLAADFPELKGARVILVHGGSSRVSPEVERLANSLHIELVYFELQVNFFGTRRRD